MTPLVCSLLSSLLDPIRLLLLARAHAVVMFFVEVVAHEFGAAGDKPVLRTAQPHIIMLPDVVIQTDVVCVPVFAERANVHGLELIPPVGAVMGAPGERPLGVQTPQPHETGVPKGIRVIVADDCTIGAPVHQHDPLDCGVGPVGKPAGSGARQGSLPAVSCNG